MKNVTGKKKPNKNASLGKRLEYIRTNIPLSQEELATKLIVDRTTINKYEKDKRLPDVQTLKSICKELNVSADYLLGLTEFESFNEDTAITHKTTGLSDNAIRNLIQLKEYGNGALLDTMNFLLEQEEYPYEEEMLNGTFNDDEIVKCHYDKSIEMWKNKNLQNILMAIDNYFHINIDGKQNLYLTHNKVQTIENFPSEEYCKAVSQKVVNSKKVIDKIYLDEINDRIVNARDKFQQGDDN